MTDKYKKMFRATLVLANIVVFFMFILWFYSKKDYSVNQKRHSYLIGASYMTMNNEFYKIISEEISAKVEAEGDRLILRDPALNADRQIAQISSMLDMGIDVLVVAPVDWESLSPVLKRAREKQVSVVVVDTNVDESGLADCTITSDNYNAGVLIGKYFVKQCKQAKVVIMTHDSAKSGQDRVKGFIDTVKKNGDIKIVEKIECEGQLEIAMPKLQEAIDKGIDFDNVFCLNDLASVGVVAALEENSMLGKVGVYGVDASPDSKVLIKENMMMASVAQFPSEIGSQTADVIYSLLNGENVEKNILVPIRLITRKNVQEFGIDRWQ